MYLLRSSRGPVPVVAPLGLWFQTHYCDHSVSVMCWDFLCLQPYFIVSQLCVADLSLNVTN